MPLCIYDEADDGLIEQSLIFYVTYISRMHLPRLAAASLPAHGPACHVLEAVRMASVHWAPCIPHEGGMCARTIVIVGILGAVTRRKGWVLNRRRLRRRLPGTL